MRGRWHQAKNETNRRKHGIRFEEAEEIFQDPLHRTAADPLRSFSENRFFSIGQTRAGILLAVAYTIDDEGDVRLISARRATRLEERRYMNIDELRDGEELEDYGDIDTRHIDWSKAKVGPQFKLDCGPANVTLDEHVRYFFIGDAEVNNALRHLIREGHNGSDFVTAPGTSPDTSVSPSLATRRTE